MSTGKFARLLGPIAFALVVLAGCGPDIDGMRSEGDVQGLIEALGDDSAEIRADAATALGELGAAAAVDPLVEALTDAEATVRAAAAAALGGLGQEAALQPLLTALDDEADEVRRAAESALSALLSEIDRQAAAAVLVDALGDESARARAAAAGALGGLGQEAALQPLLTALDDEADEVRRAAESALSALLSEVDAQAAAAVLVDALDDESATVRAAAADALGGLRNETAVVPLLEALADPAVEVSDTATLALAKLLRELWPGSAVTALVDALGDERTTVRDAADAALREFLASIGPDQAVAAIIEAGAGDAWLAVALGVPEEQLATETRRLGIQLEPLDVISNAVAVVRDGTPVAAAHSYQPSDGFHPAIVLERVRDFDETSPWELVRDGWAPTAVRFVELVVIEDDVIWEELEVCLYDGPSITRYRALQTVRVVSAIDGLLVAEQAYQGSDPRLCQATEDYYLTELNGEMPDLTPAIPWLESLIHPPG